MPSPMSREGQEAAHIRKRLEAAGWQVEEAGGGPWAVTARKRGLEVRAEAATRIEAWRMACDDAGRPAAAS